MRKLNWKKIMHDTYVELYKNAEPQADFDELVKAAKGAHNIDGQGRYIIDFMAYEIDKDKMDEIIKSFMKKYKMNPYYSAQYSMSIYLGCSPKTKTHDEISGDLR